MSGQVRLNFTEQVVKELREEVVASDGEAAKMSMYKFVSLRLNSSVPDKIVFASMKPLVESNSSKTPMHVEDRERIFEIARDVWASDPAYVGDGGLVQLDRDVCTAISQKLNNVRVKKDKTKKVKVGGS